MVSWVYGFLAGVASTLVGVSANNWLVKRREERAQVRLEYGRQLAFGIEARRKLAQVVADWRTVPQPEDVGAPFALEGSISVEIWSDLRRCFGETFAREVIDAAGAENSPTSLIPYEIRMDERIQELAKLAGLPQVMDLSPRDQSALHTITKGQPCHVKELTPFEKSQFVRWWIPQQHSDEEAANP